MSVILVLKVTGGRLVRRSAVCSAGPPHRRPRAVSSMRVADFSLGNTPDPRPKLLGGCPAKAISLGTKPLVMPWPGRQVGARIPVDAQSRYAHRLAKTECTGAAHRTGFVRVDGIGLRPACFARSR